MKNKTYEPRLRNKPLYDAPDADEALMMLVGDFEQHLDMGQLIEMVEVKSKPSVKRDYRTQNDGIRHMGSTSLQGYVNTTYANLVRAFGKSSCFDDYKSDAEWYVLFDDGTFCTIYNYKDGINYNGKSEGTPKTKITEWHVGGEQKKCVEYIQRVIDALPKK